MKLLLKIAAIGCAIAFEIASAAPIRLEIISVSSDNVAGDGLSSSPELSPDGRYVVFLSQADNLVSGYSGISVDNGFDQVYFRDRTSGQLELISVSADGTAGANSGSIAPQLSADGRYVGFLTSASNVITPGHGDTDVYNFLIRDRMTGITFAPAHDWLAPPLSEPFAYATITQSNPLITPDAILAALELDLDPNQPDDIYLLDATTQTYVDVCPPRSPYEGQPCQGPAIASGGSRVAFESSYPNLIAGGTNGRFNVFAYDVATAAIELVSVNADNSEGDNDVGWFYGENDHAISADGRYVAFDSGGATNLGGSGLPHDVLLMKDLVTGALVPISTMDDGTPVDLFPEEGPHPAFSDDATLLVFSGTTAQIDPGAGGERVFLRNMATGISRSLCRNESGTPEPGCSEPMISGDGLVIAFSATAPGMIPPGIDPGPFINQQIYAVTAFRNVFDDIFADGFDR